MLIKSSLILSPQAATALREKPSSRDAEKALSLRLVQETPIHQRVSPGAGLALV
jgi:hypothetical protein